MSRNRVHDKICLVTGAGSGIGRSTATLLGLEGATVIVSDIDARAAEHVAAGIRDTGGNAEAAALDVADESAWQAIVGTILARYPRLDVVVNNAGIGFAGPIATTTLADWRRVLSVNLDRVFLGTRYAIEAMSSRGGGSIINVASVAGIKAHPSTGAYAASKAAGAHFRRRLPPSSASTPTQAFVSTWSLPAASRRRSGSRWIFFKSWSPNMVVPREPLRRWKAAHRRSGIAHRKKSPRPSSILRPTIRHI